MGGVRVNRPAEQHRATACEARRKKKRTCGQRLPLPFRRQNLQLRDVVVSFFFLDQNPKIVPVDSLCNQGQMTNIIGEIRANTTFEIIRFSKMDGLISVASRVFVAHTCAALTIAYQNLGVSFTFATRFGA